MSWSGYVLKSVGISLLLFGILTAGSAWGQSGILEYKVCTNEQTDDWDSVIFACSRVVADTALPSEIRAQAHYHRQQASAVKRVKPSGVAPMPESELKDLAEAIRLDPKNTRYLSTRGNSYRVLKEYHRGIADYSEAIRLEPDNANHFMNRAQVFGDKGDFRRAIADSNEVIRLLPNKAYSYSGRGSYYEKDGERDKAVADYRRALSIDPNDWAGKFGLKRLVP